MTSLLTVKKQVAEIKQKIIPEHRKHLVVRTWEGCYDIYDPPIDNSNPKRDCGTCKVCTNRIKKNMDARHK